MKSVVVVQGASRGIGAALVRRFLQDESRVVLACCRNPERIDLKHERLVPTKLDVLEEASIQESADVAKKLGHDHGGGVTHVINVAGILKEDALGVNPEKKLGDLAQVGLGNIFAVNTVGPMLVGKHFLPLLSETVRKRRTEIDSTTFACFSARVGSITDNQSGGWYGYRCSKAALNAFIKSVSFEMKPKRVACVALHPGTVDTDLTRNFLQARSKYTVQPVDEAGANLANIINSITMADSGTFLDWQRNTIPW